MINYEEEVKKLEAYKSTDGGMFWKPSAGQYKVKAFGELEDAEPYTEDGKDPKPQAKLVMVVGNEGKKVWTMSKGQTMASAYGQLCHLAKENGNKLDALEFMIVVVFDGTKNSYTIIKL